MRYPVAFRAYLRIKIVGTLELMQARIVVCVVSRVAGSYCISGLLFWLLMWPLQQSSRQHMRIGLRIRLRLAFRIESS